MRCTIAVAIAALAAGAGTATSNASSGSSPDEPPDGMELVWADEFDGDTIDPSNWTFDIGGGGWGNGEAQYYTDREENARVEDGNLVIELRQERFEDSYYTSARLRTQGLREFRYGRLEARLRVPSGAGTWPAFWALGADFDPASDDPSRQWPNVGEIDIMEHVGREPDLTFGTIHGPGYSGAGGLSKWNRQDHDIADDFHTFAVDWDAAGITWFYDGEPFYQIGPDDLNGREWVFDHDFFLILNLALGGTFGGNIALDLEFPIRYEVDYVRVYTTAFPGHAGRTAFPGHAGRTAFPGHAGRTAFPGHAGRTAFPGHAGRPNASVGASSSIGFTDTAGVG